MSTPLNLKPYLHWAGTPRATYLFIAAITLLRLLYLAFFCPYNLIEDEAHYWEWSRHLDWSYYSKGPGVAWTLFLSTSLLGDTEFAVRSTAPLFAAVTALALARLARDISNDWRAAFLTAVLFTCIPAFQITGLLFLIDGPYCAAWSLCALFAYHALFTSSRLAWLAFGICFALGFLFKYTILLLLPGLIMFALMHRRNLHLHRDWKLLCAATILIALTGCAPIVIWNAQHDWVTFRHLLGHLGLAGGDLPAAQRNSSGYEFIWTLNYLVTQIAFLGGVAAAVLAAVVAARRQRSPAAIFLFALAAPIFIFYLLVSFVTEPEGNWAIAGLLTLIPLAALWMLPRLDQFAANRAARSPANGFFKLAIVLGLFTGFLMLRLDWIDTGLARLNASDKVRRIIPMSRLSGAPQQARHVHQLLGELEEDTGKPGFVIAQHYGRASQLAFYLPGQPEGVVFCGSAHTGGRTTQYDIWPHTSLARPDLLGRSAVLAGGDDEAGSIWAPAFSGVIPIGGLNGDRKRNRPAYLGLEYRGWPQKGAGE